MAFYYTNYHFTKMVINNMNDKYKEMFITDDNKIFLYSNILYLIESFRFSKLKIKSYDLKNKLNKKIDLFIKNMVLEVKKSNYDKTYITMLYAITSSLILILELNKYGINISDELYIDHSYNNSFDEKFILPKTNKDITLNESEILFISNSLKNTYYLPIIEKYINTCNLKFKKCFKPNIFQKIKYKFMDLLFYRKSNTKYKYFVYKRKYKTPHSLYIINDKYSLKYEEIISEALKKASEFSDALSEFLYFDKHSKFIKLSNNFKWNSFEEERKYVKQTLVNDKDRHKKYSIFKKNKNSNNN